jgi:hypothetical protein
LVLRWPGFWISPDFTEELLLQCFNSAAGRLNGLQPEAARSMGDLAWSIFFHIILQVFKII